MNPQESAFYEAVERYVAQMMSESPVAATHLGDHRFDDRLGDHSRSGLERQLASLRRAEQELATFDPRGFGPDAILDHAVMTRLVRSFLRESVDLKAEEREPGSYIDECLGGVFMLLLRNFAPFGQRMRSVLGRLREVPRVLKEGQANLVAERVPRVWVETALEGAKGGRQLFTVLIPLLALRTPHLLPAVLAAARRAARALDEYARFLRTEVLPKASGDFAVGRELFEEMLHDRHLLDMSADELLATGERLFAETQASMEDLARSLDPGKTARQILDEAKQRHPSARDLLTTYRREVARARAFVVEHDIATIPPDESLRVEPTPAFMRGVLPYAAYMAPGLLEPKQEGIFVVTPVSPRAPKAAQEAKLHGHCYAKLPITTLHEGYPGHHLQLVLANRTATLPRKLASALSSLFIEGWAFYCEELMEQLGFLDDPVQHLWRRKDQLWRAARIILDVSLHTKGMTIDEGVAFLVDRVGLEPADALAEVRRYTQSPTQPMTYLIGKLEILKLVEAYKARHPGRSMREIHDAILACGSLPPKLLAQRLLAG
ncbi:MAG: DUF885 domain-containing protein [Candidatus Bipolaricaulota bacterium]